MRQLILLATAAAASAFAGATPAAPQSRTLPAFTAIDDTGPATVTVTVGQPQSVVATGPDRFLDGLVTEVTNGVLHISLKGHLTFSNMNDARITISVPSLTRYEMSGAGSSTLAHVNGDTLTIECSGAGSIKVDGQVRALKVDVSGVGSIDARDLAAQTATAEVSGVGNIKVRASDTLDADVSGVGSLAYYGHPRTVNKRASGVGSVSAAD